MNRPRDTSLHIRLASITIVGLLIALAAAAYLSGRRVQSDSDLIAQDAVPGTIHAHHMRMAISRSIGWVMAAASAQTPQSRDASLKIVHDAEVAFADELKQYEKTIKINKTADWALVEKVKKSYAEFHKQRVAYEALILAGDRDGAAAFLERDLLPVFLPTIQSAEEMIRYNHGNSIALSDSIRSSVNQLYWAVAVVVVLALASAAVLVFNLTMRRRELEELRENEDKFCKAFRANPSGIAITEVDTGRYIEVNESFCRILGYPMQEIVGYTTVDKGIWSSDEERSRFIQPLLEGGTLRHREIQTRTRYGVRKILSLNAELIELVGRRCIMTLVEDVTERREWEQKQAELAAIVESSEDAIIGKTLAGIITSWNRGAEKIFGHTAAEAVGQSLRMLLPPDRQDEEAEILASITRGETVQHFETARVRKDGRQIVISATISPLRDGAGNVIGASKIARDITAQKQAEQELRWRTAFFEAQVHSAIDGILVVDSEGRKLLQNRRMNELWKIPPHIADDTNDSPQVQFVLGQVKEQAAFAEKVAHLYAHPDESSSDVIEQVDGTVLERYSAPVRGSDGKYYGRVWTFHDITELRRQEIRFRRLFESNMEGIFFWKADGSIPEANDAFLRHIGHTREDLAAGLINWRRLTPPEYLPADARALEEIAIHGICAPYEKEYIRKDGTRVPILIGASVFEGTQDGVCFILDLTERKKLEQQFLRAQRMESIGTLASGVAHDLNNILTPIMMSMSVLRMGIPEEKRAALFDTIESSAARGAQIVKQVLTFGRGLEGERHPLQIEMLITEMEQMIRSTFPKNITFESVVGPHLWLVLGDATQLHQVLLNLCVNARDAMPDGGRLRLSATNLDIDLSYASMVPEATPGMHVLLEVGDTGSGIPPEIVERIFDPFFTTKGVGKGTGLGLSTVHGIVKSHGGLLKVTSEPGKGTTFKIYLPAAPDQGGIADAAASGPPPTGHGELVLVVDDEPAITSAARTVLEAHGYRVLLAHEATEALVLFTQNPQDIALVLTDIMMPGMDGVAFLRTLRKIKHDIPVLASTGLSDKTQLAAMRELGIETILHKPYSSSTLLRRIDAVLHPRR